ncbi:MAG: hypothetical protein EVA41_02820 [Flavobacteriales bacterium]|nr:MAG: hypothetical protein EVA41_02820 [Flavobacteriales bacterium]|tara:strand:- start:189 stop:680 length:492 start_codon:yes stop_codon:yes gene_type:complete
MKHIYLIIIIFITTVSFSQEEKIVKAKQNAISSMSLVDALSTRIPGARRITDRMGNQNIALRGRQSFKTAGDEVIWEIDGIIYNNPPVLYIEQVKYVEVLNGVSATNKYGSEGAAGVIIVKTIVNANQINSRKNLLNTSNKIDSNSKKKKNKKKKKDKKRKKS